MVVPSHINSKYSAIIFEDVDGEIKARTSASGTLTPTGLTKGGQDTIMTASDTTWIKLERSATTNPAGSGIKSNRNSLKITNTDNAINIKTTINSDPNGDSQTYAVGDEILPGNSQFLDVAELNVDTSLPIDIWVLAESGSPIVFFREIA